MDMAGITPKTRKPNFSESETLMIIDQVKKHKEILTSKFTDAVTNERKKEIWTKICDYINTRHRNVNRIPHDIRRRWKNMVGAARKEVARVKGVNPGSEPAPAPSDLSMQILDINPEWQDFTSLNENGSDPGMSSYMKVEVGENDDDDDVSHFSDSPESPGQSRPHMISKVGENSCDAGFMTPSMTSCGSDNNQSGAKKRRVEEASQLHQEIMHLDRENMALEKERMKIEREKLTMEKEQVAIERQKLGMEREKLAMEKEKMNMEKQKLCLEINYWKRKLLQLTRPVDNNDG